METGTYAIKNANVFLTYRQKFEPRTIVVRDGRIAAVLDPDADAAMESIDAQGMYVIPGMTDVHMHIESSMTHPKEFSRWALRYGTTGIVADAHEIVNVFGMDGQFAFMNQETDLDILWAIPSSVPATNPSLETSGAEMTVEDVKRMLADPRVVSLGEVMNMKDLLSIIEQLQQRNVSLVSLRDNIDTGSTTGKLIMHILNYMNSNIIAKKHKSRKS